MKRRQDGLLDQLHRYRGVLALVAIPVLLIALVVLVMPRSVPEASGTVTAADSAVVAVAQENNPLPAGQGREKYAVVVDAGSTGSRVHVYKFLEAEGTLELQSDTFEQLKPGLSSYADDPEAAADSLRPLLQKALEVVPHSLQASTPIKVGATAGLRLLPEGKADVILDRVRAWLHQYPFQADAKRGVTILDGSDEGAFAWLTLNYLLGHLGEPEGSTVAAIDLGGGSVQEAFALSDADAAAAPDPLYVTSLSGGGRAYNVYVHSYLGYGLMAGRAAVLAWEETRGANPCIPTDHTGVFEYGGTKYELIPAPDGASSEACARLMQLVLRQNEPCGAEQDKCSFAGAWGGGHLPKAFYVSSYFWDRATEAEIIKDHGAISHQLSAADLKAAADQACKLSLSDMKTVFPDVKQEQAAFMCLDLSFCYSLLTQGFKVAETTEITVVKRIKYKSQEVEAAWSLGAAINLLNS